MSTDQFALPARGNRLLDRLPAAAYDRLVPLLKPVELAFKEVLYESRGPIEYAYFPTGAVASALTVMLDGSAIEVATVGMEGLVGHTAAFGSGKTSPTKSSCKSRTAACALKHAP